MWNDYWQYNRGQKAYQCFLNGRRIVNPETNQQ
jgi:hypothetical protein